MWFEGSRTTGKLGIEERVRVSSGPWLVGTTKVYAGVGADIAMESIALTMLVFEMGFVCARNRR
jgi:hypothetical protein